MFRPSGNFGDARVGIQKMEVSALRRVSLSGLMSGRSSVTTRPHGASRAVCPIVVIGAAPVRHVSRKKPPSGCGTKPNALTIPAAVSFCSPASAMACDVRRTSLELKLLTKVYMVL